VASAVTVDGHRDLLGLWAGDGGEGAEFWLQVLTELRSRGVEDVCMVVSDGLKGLPEAIAETWPRAVTQTWVIHLLRASFRYAARQHRDAIARGLEPVHTAPTGSAALERFVEFAEAWGTEYPAIVRLWENAWTEFVPFLTFDTEIRKVVCSTNAIESVNAPHPPRGQGPRSLPERAGRPQMRLPRRDEPGPHRPGPQTLDHPVEVRFERLRDHLRRTPLRRPQVTPSTPVTPNS
jgi:hypothetical protein